jgi:hypothetical protein
LRKSCWKPHFTRKQSWSPSPSQSAQTEPVETPRPSTFTPARPAEAATSSNVPSPRLRYSAFGRPKSLFVA